VYKIIPNLKNDFFNYVSILFSFFGYVAFLWNTISVGILAKSPAKYFRSKLKYEEGSEIPGMILE